MDGVNFALRDRKNVEELDTARQRLGCARQALKTGRARENETARNVATVEFGPNILLMRCECLADGLRNVGSGFGSCCYPADGGRVLPQGTSG